MPDDYEMDEQDQAEVFDEDNLSEDGDGHEIVNFDDMPDVYDVTTAAGDRDIDETDLALDADEYDPDDLTDEDLEDDDLDDQVSLRDRLETEAEDAELDADVGELVFDDDGRVDPIGGDFGERDLEDPASDRGEVELVYESPEELAAHRVEHGAAQRLESSRELSDDDVKALGYGDGGPTPTHADDDDAAETLDDDEPTDPAHPKHRQEKLLDEGLEESFPASDPVSVKRIT